MSSERLVNDRECEVYFFIVENLLNKKYTSLKHLDSFIKKSLPYVDLEVLNKDSSIRFVDNQYLSTLYARIKFNKLDNNCYKIYELF